MPKILKKYRTQSFFALKSFSIGLLISMIGYYAIVLFHLPNPIKLIKSQGLMSKLTIHYMAIFFLFLLLGAGTKFGALLVGGWITKTRPNKAAIFMSISIFLVGIGMTLLSVLILSEFLSTRVSNSYWKNSHLFWVALLLFLLFSYFSLLLKRYELFTKEALTNLSAIPIISPVFCFGGPYFFGQNLAFKNLPQTLLNIYYTISFSSGIFFVAFLILNAFLRAKTDKNKTSSTSLILPNQPVGLNKRESKLLIANYLLLGLGAYLLCVLVIDMTLMLIF